MRLASFALETDGEGGERVGLVVGEDVVELRDIDPSFPSGMNEVLEAGRQLLERAREAIGPDTPRRKIAELKIKPPVRPRKIFAIGLNYADHVAESGMPTPKYPTVFTKAPTSVAGPFDPIERPAVSTDLDYEGELGVVIGKTCRHVAAEHAAEVIAGYLVVNDVTARDWQFMTQQWSLGKSFDTHAPIGPWLVTPDEVGDPHALELKTFVNDELRQHSNTSNLIFRCEQIIEILSQACTLQPGDVIATGTPSGVAGSMEGTPWLTPGDRVRVEIEKLGAIENEVIDEVVDPGSARRPAGLPGFQLP